MDGQEYLNQISASTRPVEQSKLNKILTSKYFLIGTGAVVALIIIIIIGSLISGGKSDEKSDCIALYLHTNTTSELINAYQDPVKSSDLRASSSSLNTVLQDTNKKLTEYLTLKYKFKDSDVSKKTKEKLALEYEEQYNELFNAKINGVLDRVFAHKMAYEIQLFVAESNQIKKETEEKALEDILDTFSSSLENLYSKFNDFSEGQ